MDTRIKNIIKNHWEQMIDGACFYRGMSLKDINLKSDIVLNPNQNPHDGFMPLFLEYSEFLLSLIGKGLEFHVNDFYVEPLQKVLNWIIRDIKNPGVDFTTNYADAAAYAFNYAGSQIKHNFNIITSTIHECEKQNCFDGIDKQKFQGMTIKIKKLLKVESNLQHKPIIIKVKRSCESFHDDMAKELNFGNFDFFLKRILEKAKDKDALVPEKIAFFLHQQSQVCNFNIRLVKPLYKKDIEKIMEL